MSETYVRLILGRGLTKTLFLDCDAEGSRKKSDGAFEFPGGL
jgi:hypothetical protein